MIVPFPRTVCACLRDMSYCRLYSGYLIPSDLPALAEELMRQGRIEEPTQALGFLRASKGALVADSLTGRLRRIGTITPRMEDGRCVFLDERNLCTIHAVAPYGCSHFDVHMLTEEADRRSLWGLRRIEADPQYESVRRLLIDVSGEEFEPLLLKKVEEHQHA